MALFRKFFYRKPPEGLLEISERVYVFDCCFTTNVLSSDEYDAYIGRVVDQLREYFPDSSFIVFSFGDGDYQIEISNVLAKHGITVVDYPSQNENCPVLTVEMINHFLRSSESWLSIGQRNVLLMHCQNGAYPVLAFMLSAFLIYRKLYTGEKKTLDMVYQQAPQGAMHLLSPVDPMPSQLRYLQYVSSRNIGSRWPPLDRALTLDCVILRSIPDMDGKGGCRPIFRVFGPDPLMAADPKPKLLFSMHKRSKAVTYFKQVAYEIVKIDINCHVQGDVVLECTTLDDNLEDEEMMFRVMFNTAFIRSNVLMLNCEELDTLWNAKDHFPEDFRAEVLFSDMDSTSSIVMLDSPTKDDIEGLPVEAFSQVHDIFNDLDWGDAEIDNAINLIQQMTVTSILEEKLDFTGFPGSRKESWQNVGQSERDDDDASLDVSPTKTWSPNWTPLTGSTRSSFDFDSLSKKIEPDGLLVSVHRHPHSNIVSCAASPHGSPGALTRYRNAAPSAVGITALLQDHAEPSGMEVKPLQVNAVSAPPPPPPPPLQSCPVLSPSLPPPPPPPPTVGATEHSSSVPSSPPPPPPSSNGLTEQKSPKAIPPPPPPKKEAPASVPPPPAPSKPGGASTSLLSSASTLLGAKGKLQLRNSTKTAKKSTLKPYHWLKLTRAMQGSLWADAQKPEEASKAPVLDLTELESLFSASVPNADRDRKTNRLGSNVKSEKVHLIELRRAYNCEIMLTKVKIAVSDLMKSVIALDDSSLDADQVENLIKFCPTKEEIELLKNYKGDVENLGKCEQFFMEVMHVPRVENKLRVFYFKIQFNSQVSDLRNNLNTVNSISEEVRSSVKLKRIMQTILSLGNALNQGTARGSAVGFRLDSLPKLAETRGRNNKLTLIHYLCKVLAEKLPEVLDFHEDLQNLEAATKVQLKYLAEEMQAISKGLEKVVQELTASENDGAVSELFCKILKNFLGSAEAEVRSLAALYSGVGRNADSLAQYFGEDPARCPFEQVVSTLLNFVRMFQRAHEENCKQLEFEKKKKAQEEADNKKTKPDDDVITDAAKLPGLQTQL